MVVCAKIEKIDHLFQYVGVNLRVTFEGVAVSFPSGYGLTFDDERKSERSEDQIIFNSFNSVIGQFDTSKRILKLLKEPMPFLELRDEFKQSIRVAVQQMQKEKVSSASVALTKEMIQSSEFPCTKFTQEFTSK